MRFKQLDEIGAAIILLYCGWVYYTLQDSHLSFRSTEALHFLQTDYLVGSATIESSNSDPDDQDPPEKKQAVESVPDYRELNFESESKGAPDCSSLQDDEIDFTFVTQLSLDRIWIMQEHCSRWGLHPISVALGGNISYSRAVDLIQGLGCDMRHVSIQVTNDFSGASEYPVNRLRNMALSTVKTSHAIVMDADFLISENLYEHLMLHRPLLHDPKHALVIPAFQLLRQCLEQKKPGCRGIHLQWLPKSKNRLIKLLLEVDHPAGPLITPFGKPKNFYGHSSTRLGDWLEQPIEQLLPIDCVESTRYEPYLVVRYCKGLPPFQNAFEGFGKNKITWVRHLVRTGYRFSQISGGFTVHFPHNKSESKIIFQTKKGSLNTKSRVNQIADNFGNWLIDKVTDETKMPLCQATNKTKCLRGQVKNPFSYDCCREKWHPKHERLCKQRYTETNSS